MIYRQTRIGKDYQPFEVLKFRTMEEGKITRPWLRRTGLDELPQFINVLRGEMALFGPRPERPGHDLYYFINLEDWWERYTVKPGILGLAQVKGVVRNGDRYTLARKGEQARLDAEQIRRSETFFARLLLKTEILIRLPWAIIKGQKGGEHDTSTASVRQFRTEPSPHWA